MQQDEKCGSCGPEQSGECGGGSKAGIDMLPENDNSRIKNVIAIMSGKGGVGKSSVTSLLACGFNRRGYRVGVLDADITGPSVPKMFGIKGMARSNGMVIFPSLSSAGVKIMSLNLLIPNEDDCIIWRGPLIAGTVKQFWTDVAWGELDYLFVDLPPGTGDVPLTVMQSLPLNGLIVVSTPQELASMIVKKAINMARQMNVPIVGLIENMTGIVCPHCGQETVLFGPGRGRELSEMFGITFLGSIPLDPRLSELADGGQLEEYHSDLFDQQVPAALTREGVKIPAGQFVVA